MNVPSYNVEFTVAAVDDLQGDLAALFIYWSALRGTDFAPPWRTFDWNRLPPKLIPWCAIVDVCHNPPGDFIYRFWGTARSRLQGRDYTGMSVDDFEPAVIGDKAKREYQWVVERKAPLHIRTDGMQNDRAESFSYDFLRLPFSDTGAQVDQILGVGIYDGPSFKRAFDYYGTNPASRPRPAV